MKMFKAVTAVCGLVLMGSLITTTAKADEWNQKTVVTFNGPVEIPGVHVTGWGVLPARHLCVQASGFAVGPPYRPNLG